MKRLLLLVLLTLNFSISFAQTTIVLPSGTTPVTPGFRKLANVPDSLNQLWMQWDGKINRVYTATELGLILNTKTKALTITPIKTANYTANPNDFVQVSDSLSNITITLPNAPANGTQVGVKIQKQFTPYTVAITASGTDVINLAPLQTINLTYKGQGRIFQYYSATKSWVITGSDNVTQIASKQDSVNAHNQFLQILTPSVSYGSALTTFPVVYTVTGGIKNATFGFGLAAGNPNQFLATNSSGTGLSVPVLRGIVIGSDIDTSSTGLATNKQVANYKNQINSNTAALAAKVDKTTTVAGFPLSLNVTLATLTPGPGIIGSGYNGSTAYTWVSDTTYNRTVSNSFNKAQIQTLLAAKEPVQSGTGYVKKAGTTTSYVAAIPNSDLANSTITINGISTALGGTTRNLLDSIANKQYINQVIAATNANTVSTIVKRDASGNFSAGTITANLTGTASGNVASITGTANQVIVGGTATAPVLSLPQSIATNSNVTFGSITQGAGATGTFIQPYTGGGAAAIYSTANTPGATNYAIAYSASSTVMNATTNLNLQIAGANVAAITSSGINISGTLGISGNITAPSITANGFNSFYATGSNAAYNFYDRDNTTYINAIYGNAGNIYIYNAQLGNVVTIAHATGNMSVYGGGTFGGNVTAPAFIKAAPTNGPTALLQANGADIPQSTFISATQAKTNYAPAIKASGKKAAFIGDSFTQLRIYQDTLISKLNLTQLISDGIGGSCITGGTGNAEGDGTFRKSIVSRVAAALATNPNIIIIEGGSNDFHYNVTLGNVSSTDTTTFYGALNYALQLCAAQQVSVALVTPSFRTDAQKTGGSSGLANYQNMLPYVQAMKEMAYKYSANLVDAFNCGINYYNTGIYTTDGVHPNNTAGRFIYANFIVENIGKQTNFNAPIYGQPIYTSQSINSTVNDNTRSSGGHFTNTNAGTMALTGFDFTNNAGRLVNFYLGSSNYVSSDASKPFPSDYFRIQSHNALNGLQFSYNDDQTLFGLDGTGGYLNNRLNLTSTTQSERFRFSGQEYNTAGNTSTDGVSVLLGVNRTGNRQLWFFPSDNITPNATNFGLRFALGTNASPGGATIGAVSSDGTTLGNLNLSGSTVTAPTPTFGTNNTQVETTAGTYQVGRALVSAGLINYISKTAAYTVVGSDFTTGNAPILNIEVDCTSGAVTITLPDPGTYKGYQFFVTKTDNSANAVTVASTSGAVLGGNTLTTQYQSRQFFSNTSGVNYLNH